MSSSLSQSSRCLLKMDSEKPSPPVLPTWLPYQSSMGSYSSCTVFPTQTAHGSLSKWPLLFIQSWSPCWTPLSIALEIKMWRTQSGDLSAQNCTLTWHSYEYCRMCVWVYTGEQVLCMQLCMCECLVCTFVCACGGQRLTLGVFLGLSPPYVLKRCFLFLRPEVTDGLEWLITVS